MPVNVGNTDRLIRALLGLAAAYWSYSTGGSLAWVGYLVAALLLVTAALGRCGVYKLLGINTCPVKKS